MGARLKFFLFFVLPLWVLFYNFEQSLEQLEQPGITDKSSIFEKWGARLKVVSSTQGIKLITSKFDTVKFYTAKLYTK